VNENVPEQADRAAWFRAIVSRYRGMSNAKLWGDTEVAFNEVARRRFLVSLGWPVPHGRKPQDVPESEVEAFCDQLAPQYRFQGERYLRPPVGENPAPAPSPLMTWWLLLYAFSMIARYQPRKWAETLDLDRSPNAAVIQHALEVAMDVLPHLILEALDQAPVLVRRPLRL
jgi:YaaC-like protein